MAVITGTGLGGTLTAVGLTNFTVGNWEYVSITGYEETVAVLDDTHLGSTTFEESIPVSLAALPEMVVTVHWQYDEQSLFAGNLSVGEVASFTITMPTRIGFSTAGTLVGDAFFTSIKMPDHTTGDRSMGTFTLKWTGKTGPTYTASTA